MDDKKDDKTASFMEFLIDSAKDRRKDGTFFKVALCVVVVLFIVGMVLISLHSQKLIKDMASENQKLFVDFLSEYDFETEIELDTSRILWSDNSGNINYYGR